MGGMRMLSKLTPLPVALCLSLGTVSPVVAHPHVFVDGGVDFVFDDGGTLTALQVTWFFDAFETLYMISEAGLRLNAEGGLDESDRLEMERQLSDWPDDFDGSAHLTLADAPVPLMWPEAPRTRMVDGRLEMTFQRRLETPLEVDATGVEVAFYESTYFFDFTVTRDTLLMGGATGCASTLIPFNPDANSAALQAALAMLSREETPEISNVGANFADRIVVTCER